MRCSAWRDMAEHCAQSLSKGMRVIAQGRLQQRSYQANDGSQRTVVELQVDEIGPSLRYATAQVTRTSSANGGNFAGNRGGNNFAGGNGGFNNGGFAGNARWLSGRCRIFRWRWLSGWGCRSSQCRARSAACSGIGSVGQFG